MELDTKVTKVKDKWHCRLLKDGSIIDEMACNDRQDIGFCFHEMLRWYDKLGGSDKMASASRARWKKVNKPVGKVEYARRKDNVPNA